MICDYCERRAVRKIGNRWVCDDSECIIKAVKKKYA